MSRILNKCLYCDHRKPKVRVFKRKRVFRKKRRFNYMRWRRLRDLSKAIFNMKIPSVEENWNTSK